MVEAIARAEKSVVAIARVPKDRTAENTPLEFRPDAFGRRMARPAPAGPTDPDFVPRDFASGVIIDRQGLILTAYHALGEDSEYYVTTSERKVYRASIKGADPRSDLAVLAIEAADLSPIVLGDAAKLKKGQIVIALGNPYAIARDGQASASWGIVANLARKAPLGPGRFRLARQEHPAPLRHLDPDRRQAQLRHQRGRPGESQGRDGRIDDFAGRPGRIRAVGRLCLPGRCDVPPRGGDAQAGPRGGIRAAGHPADGPLHARDAAGHARHAGRIASSPARPPSGSASATATW